MRRTPTWFLAAAALALPAVARAAEPPPFAWKDGDRVVLIGDTFIERGQSYGHLETLVTARNPDKTIVFRNLGWSADTPLGLSRAAFDPPEAGFRRLKEHVLALRPTVLVVGYGMAASFRGEEGLPAFVSGLNTLLDALAPLKARTVFLSPIAHEDLGRPLPDPAAHNKEIERYRDAIRKVAEDRGAWFVDLVGPTHSAHDYGIDPLTDNGIHPTAYGYWYLDSVIDADLRGVKQDRGWAVSVSAGRGGRGGRPSGVTVSNVEATADRVRFTATDAELPMPPAPGVSPEAVVWLGAKRSLRVAGLAPGDYVLTVDGRPVARADDASWIKGVPIYEGPEFDQVEALRRAVNEKNRLYFYRWRPQNETYLFGFRKHEQGNNAREIPLFDPLVEAKEKEIARLKRPVPHVYELRREGGASL